MNFNQLLRLIRIPSDTSQFGEQEMIANFLSKLHESSDFIIDIGASNGVDLSNTYHLFRAGHPGLAIEAQGKEFAKLSAAYKDFNVILHRGYVTPGNILLILESADTPPHPKYMNLDIDSCDYFVLESILTKYRPSLITVEINETIPPGICFAVLPNSDIVYTPYSHFYGMSISMLGNLCKKYEYEIVGLNYINAFLIPKEENEFPSFMPEEAYRTGYLDKPDRKQKFPWNADMEELLSMDQADGIAYLNNLFSSYRGKYILSD